ncbi:hypothetical protein ACQUWN_20945 [Rossellomorea aquimaris]|uniref:hypothetical protein n=1 Tax=Bacillaceae TaxID=186817 RepID=UPI001653AA59|nr:MULTISPECIES: hypothetical protein [Bacillaceae]
MLNLLKKLSLQSKCAICKQKPKQAAVYFNDRGQKVKVCAKCVPYAERRAFRK